MLGPGAPDTKCYYAIAFTTISYLIWNFVSGMQYGFINYRYTAHSFLWQPTTAFLHPRVSKTPPPHPSINKYSSTTTLSHTTTPPPTLSQNPLPKPITWAGEEQFLVPVEGERERWLNGLAWYARYPFTFSPFYSRQGNFSGVRGSL